MNANRYALVTGASRGIGRAIAVRLAKDGYRIIINFVSNRTEAENTLAQVREAGSDGEMLPFDVADGAAVQAALAEWQGKHDGDYISVLVNNAGVRKDGLLLWMPEDDWHKVLSVSLDGF